MSHQPEFEQTKNLLDEIQKKIEGCRAEFDDRFDTIDERLVAIRAELARLNDELTTAVSKMRRGRN